MSGGEAFVYDADGTFPSMVNPDMVDLDPLTDDERDWLHEVVARHLEETESTLAGRLLGAWTDAVERFVKVMPKDYKLVLEAERKALEDGTDPIEAVMAASRG
jgi:glutamate synthase (NADPH/NADH) large chain